MENDRIIKLSKDKSVVLDDGNIVLINLRRGKAFLLNPEEIKVLKKVMEVCL